ncbi:hypothetical protein C8E95_4722 [Pseudonocardia autotrophica]|uniref:ARB-07466-like C-terminal domain-containing protein n=3 Tax=Pseudonocardia TaxID=1847 RepID=A0A1Y2MSA9_PSEAH|nr:hypothetical protein BG845_04277 [Pseudonocardia autotrophica]TDN75545.1 hypothetical protein C8E95_4722 [Pseudonocardia autotrophica]
MLVPALLAALLAAPGPAAAEPPEPSGIDHERVPEAARPHLPLITELTTDGCPELPAAWVVAQVQAESGWNPELRTGSAVGLLQVSERTWTAAGGAPWPDPALTDPAAHLRTVVPWLCATLRAAAGHLATTPKDVTVLDAMLVCHIAGCRRVSGSANGIPAAGEAGCSQACASAVRRYLDAVHELVAGYSTGTPQATPETAPPSDPAAADPGAAPPADPATAAAPAWTGGETACGEPDPVRSDGCLTGATAHGLAAVRAAFDPVIDTVGCWDEHPRNPRSDHPRGLACDLFTGPAGRFPEEPDLAEGWRIAHWLAANAEPLQIRYLIWQGRYWDPAVREDGTGWGRRYTGGAVYDTSDPTGGHYDHIHVSFAQ